MRRQSDANVIQREQIIVVGGDEGGFLLGAERHRTVPWHLLRSCHLYAVDEGILLRLLEDAAVHGHQVADGSVSDRRGMGGFAVQIGPHGIDGSVHCRRIDAWAIEVEDLAGLPTDPSVVPGWLEERLRGLCERLNEELVGFRPTAIGFLRSLYDRYGRPLEPSESFPPTLPEEVGKLCRAAHVGGPVVHARTSVAPFVRLDRSRAYGEAMTGDVPSGSPVRTDDAAGKWRTGQLRRAMGVAEATVRVKAGPLIPLLPVIRWNAAYDRTRTIHATGTFRGSFVLEELAALEEAGLGEVVEFHRVFVFERSRALSPVVRWIRKLEPDFRGLVTTKRLEHVLYGNQSRALTFRRFGSVPSHREPVLQDILDSRSLERVRSAVSLWRMGVKTDPSLPLWEARGSYSMSAPHGTLDRPDRAAVVTARNRIEVGKMIRILDERLSSTRSGEHVGRILVDGLDVESRIEDLGDLPEGWSVKGSGQRLDIHRANVTVTTHDDGSETVEDGGLLRGEAPSRQRLLRILSFTADPDGGPLASGRYWPQVPGVGDIRLLPDQRSEPIDFAEGAFDGLGFSLK